jgi:hypothetical protein
MPSSRIGQRADRTRITRLAISSGVRSTSACCPGSDPFRSISQVDATASYAVSGPTAVKATPDKLKPAPPGAADDWKDRFRRSGDKGRARREDPEFHPQRKVGRPHVSLRLT